MPIASTDILYKYSVKTGSAGNTTTGTAAGSLGKYVSNTVITDAALDNLFDDITGDENAAGDIEYRCVFVHNSHPTLALLRAVVWIPAEVAGGANTAIATDNIGPTPVGQSAAQAAFIADENTAPTSVSVFSSPTTKSAGLSLGDIPAGGVAAVWIKRTATNSAAQNNDGLTLRVEGDTAA